jgi:ectoine hydroxylase-related dioxygenase (phytanoyl-CoA dioxygenase family)
MNKLSFFEKKGYSVINLFTNNEINLIKKLIENKVYDQIIKFKQTKNFNFKKLNSYHRNNFSKKTHEKILESKSRYIKFDHKFLKKLKKNKFILQTMNKTWGHNLSLIKWVGSLKRKEIKDNVVGFRIVRPSKKFSKDSAGKHVDINVGGKICSDKKVLLSVWVPIYGFSNKFSLSIAPESHLANHSSKNYKKKNYISKIFKENYTKKFKFIRLNLKKGQAILFHPNLIHGGASNLGVNTRVSAEIRYYNKKNIHLWLN